MYAYTDTHLKRNEANTWRIEETAEQMNKKYHLCVTMCDILLLQKWGALSLKPCFLKLSLSPELRAQLSGNIMMAEEQDHEGLVCASGGEGDTVGD